MIDRGHAHNLVPVAVRERPDGSIAYQSRCNDRLVENADHELVERHPGCGLEEERVFDAQRRPTSIRYRYGGLWFSALDLVRLLPLPVHECETCHGETRLVPCPTCAGAGLVTDGGILAPPNLNVT